MGTLNKKIIEATSDHLDVANDEIAQLVDQLVDSDHFENNLKRRVTEVFTQYAVEELGTPATLRFGDEFAFFDDYLSLAYQVGGFSARGWCARWWAHPSARFRIRAMWTAFEALAHKVPATCDEEFLRTIGDHHMRVLLGEESPMVSCNRDHQPSTPLKSEPIPAGVTEEDPS